MGITLFKNVDIGFVPPTPATPHSNSSMLLAAMWSLVDRSSSLGHVVGYIQEQQGSLIQNIVPVHKTEYQQISTSSKVQLALHTETAFHPYKPDYVLLLCLRGDPTAVTTYANVDEIVSYLDSETIDYLQKDCYITSIDESFRTKGEPDVEFKLAVLSKKHDGYDMIYDEALMEGETPLAQDALKKLSEAIKKSVREIVLETKDLIVIDNNKTIHGRKPFQPRYNGDDRWVQRMLVRKELPTSDQLKGNVIKTSFSKGTKWI